MTFEEGIKNSGHPFYIPDCPRSGLPEFYKSLGFKTGAEIGVYKGKFCEKFCLQGIKMYAIDDWASTEGEDPQRQEYLYNYSKKVLARAGNSTVIRKSSMEAVKDFEPNSLDFVYIDADHHFGGIAHDLEQWYKRVKPGGIVSGHDYSYTGENERAQRAYYRSCQVGFVVNAFVEAFGIDNFYVFGRSKPIEQESKNDRYLSWMFSKSDDTD